MLAYLSYFLNTCGHLPATSPAFCIRVRRIHRFRKSGNTLARGGPRDFSLQQHRRISRTRVQTKVLTDVSYSKPLLLIKEYVIFLRHGTACCVFGKSVYFLSTCAKCKYQLAWHIRNHHFPSKNTLYQGHAEKFHASQPASRLAGPLGAVASGAGMQSRVAFSSHFWNAASQPTASQPASQQAS